ncbi:MAG: hypothetical protein Fur0024_4180 [Patescibacteria group bacterium]
MTKNFMNQDIFRLFLAISIMAVSFSISYLLITIQQSAKEVAKMAKIIGNIGKELEEKIISPIRSVGTFITKIINFLSKKKEK